MGDLGKPTPATNLIMNSFSANADGQLAVTYTIVGHDAPPFSIGIYQSAEGVQPTNLVRTIDRANAIDATGVDLPMKMSTACGLRRLPS
jgi:hypothetical protein